MGGLCKSATGTAPDAAPVVGAADLQEARPRSEVRTSQGSATGFPDGNIPIGSDRLRGTPRSPSPTPPKKAVDGCVFEDGRSRDASASVFSGHLASTPTPDGLD